jgi:putative transcriptional regulator
VSEVIYNRIEMLRAERGISRRERADALGVHYQTVGYLERGEYSPSLHLALRIAAHFEVPAEVIFSTEPFPQDRLADDDAGDGARAIGPAPSHRWKASSRAAIRTAVSSARGR